MECDHDEHGWEIMLNGSNPFRYCNNCRTIEYFHPDGSLRPVLMTYIPGTTQRIIREQGWPG